MALRLITADERLSDANLKVTMCIFGPWGVGKTSLLHTLDPDTTLFINLEAGDKSVQTHTAHEYRIRSWVDFTDLACLLGGPNPAAPSLNEVRNFSQMHYDHIRQVYADFDVGRYKTIFVDSITDLTRTCMQWAKTQPDALSEKTGKPDTRGAYGLLGRDVIYALKHLQHAPGKNVIFVGVLEPITDEFNRTTWQPQMEGGKIGRELPGIVDQVVTMAFFDYDQPNNQWQHKPGKGANRVLVCKSPNPWELPAKDRSSNLEMIEEPHLGKLIEKIHRPAKTAAERLVFSRPEANPAAV